MHNNGMEELIFYGDDIKIARFPRGTRFFYANAPVAAAPDPLIEISDALDHPLGAKPLERQLNSKSRVTIAFDDLCLPLPLMKTDPRGLVIEELLKRLFKIGIPTDHIRLICANGLHRKWTFAELSIILGKKVITALGPGRIECHDATRADRLIDLGTVGSGCEIEINRAVDEMVYPLTLEKFHPGHHPAYIDFWEKDLLNHMDPEYCWSKLSESYAENPVYLDKYRNHFAYHGTHGLINWMWSGMALRHVKSVVLAGARQPDVARKLGFTPAHDLDAGIDMARDMVGKEAIIRCQVIPPLFGVEVEI